MRGQSIMMGVALALGFVSACNLITGVGGLPFGTGGGVQATGGAGGSQGSSGTGGKGGAPGSGGSTSSTGGSQGPSGTGGADAGDGGADDAGTTDAGADAPSGPPTAAQLLALTKTCSVVSAADYENDINPVSPGTIPVCGLNGAFFWQAGMSIDCDGLSSTSTQCPSTSNQTAATDSQGKALDSVTLPYVIVPAESGCSPVPFKYGSNGLAYGSVIAVIYNGKVTYGVFGDVGVCNTIGQASYAMAMSLGINPGPSNPGVESGVTYIAFKGTGAVASPIEDHAKATTLGEMLATQLIADN